jgi:hypothetical protein
MKKHPAVSANIRAVLSIPGVGRKRVRPDIDTTVRASCPKIFFFISVRAIASHQFCPSAASLSAFVLHISCMASRCDLSLRHGMEYAESVGREENA